MSRSTIKSKKEKINQKKFSKGTAPTPIEIVADSDEQDQSIQKRAINRTLTIQNQVLKRPNAFNFQKLKKIQFKQVQKPIERQDSLQCIDTQKQIGDFLNNRSLISYKLEGKQGLKFASQSHHKERAFDQIQTLQKKQRRKQYLETKQLELIMSGQELSEDDSNKSKKNLEQKEPQKQKKESKKFFRYFQQVNEEDDQQNEGQRAVRCFKCLKRGHIAKNCFQEQVKIKCSYCLGDHHCSQCTSSPCFRCNQLGHIAQECRSKGIQCRKCHKRGHIFEDCGVVIFLDFQDKTDKDLQRLYKLSDMKKLICLEGCKDPLGHFNCHRYDLTNLQPYKSQKKVKQSQRPTFFPRRYQGSSRSQNQRTSQYQRYPHNNRYDKYDRSQKKQRR